jgi:hypothetical protein
LGFTASFADASLFVLKQGSVIVYLLPYVDDIIITGLDSTVVSTIISQLLTTFEVKDLGPLRYFLGLQIDYKKAGFFVHQSKYITDLLTKFKMSDCKAASTLIAISLILSTSGSDSLADPTPYRSLVSALQYATFTRPDITFAVNRVCQFMHNPSFAHFVAAKRILSYLKGSLDKGVFFQPGPLTLVYLNQSIHALFCIMENIKCDAWKQDARTWASINNHQKNYVDLQSWGMDDVGN